ncbi:hypothetical protein BD410DRAFT_839895 [Rickenella mellea]|uniref:Uncharacterized protein n=1 Tax=Rickenella mellea TaxID=50990 RepID=A0A4Y7Q4G6_9AGAM|nr:hypothetical protein BD410DRAFT_839895 [Rickenella mellea]
MPPSGKPSHGVKTEPSSPIRDPRGPAAGRRHTGTPGPNLVLVHILATLSLGLGPIPGLVALGLGILVPVLGLVALGLSILVLVAIVLAALDLDPSLGHPRKDETPQFRSRSPNLARQSRASSDLLRDEKTNSSTSNDSSDLGMTPSRRSLSRSGHTEFETPVPNRTVGNRHFLFVLQS